MAAIGCVPANLEDRMGIPFEPPDLSAYTTVACDGCNMPVLIGPNQQALKFARPELECLCPKCAIADGHLTNESQIVNLEALLNPGKPED
jgi:hypothetical protein